MAATRWGVSVGLAFVLVLWPAIRMLDAEEEKPVGAGVASTAAQLNLGENPVVERKAASAVSTTHSAVPGKRVKIAARTDTSGQSSEKPEDAKTTEPIRPVHRPSSPGASPNPDEFKFQPNSTGRIRLRFNDQPWQPVLQWLATISGMSLDWQELPGDSLNLSTQRSYTVPEVRDLINRLLLDRGFTLLSHGEVLTVAEIKKIDPSLVPRVEPADLPNRQPYEFVKVSFPLVSLEAETAVDDLKPMLSPNGRLASLSEMNCLEAMDAVTNLRDIGAVLKRQADENQPKSFREFKLKHAHAPEVRRLLTTFLDLDSQKSPPMSGEQQLKAIQEQAMMIAKMQPGMPAPGGNLSKSKAVVRLAVNERNNSIMVQARPDKMAVIAQFVTAVDIPVDQSGSLLDNLNRVKVYRLSGIDPEPVVKTLMEVGNLDPATKLEVDKENSAIVAYASLPDHVTIRTVVDRVKGTARKFEVVQLRRLAADYVAGMIEFMMGAGAKKEKARTSPWWGPFDSSGRDAAESSKEFHVDVDVERNRLLLWANSVELAAIEALLVKLGENPAAGRGSAVRVIHGGDAKEMQELIKRIRRVWPSIAPNPLVAPAAEEGKGPAAPQPALPKDSSTTSPLPKPSPIRAAAQAQAAPFHLADMRSEPTGKAADERERDDARPAPAPVKIVAGPDGKLILSSEDARALDRLEELAAQLATPRTDYRVFRLKNAWAAGVVTNLEDFFKNNNKEPSRSVSGYYDDGFDSQNDAQNDRRLSKRRKLTFLADADSNTILVQGASAEQLETIEKLIQLYDEPPPSDTQSVRKTQLIRLKNTAAKAVADTVKEVYRDLLSANDKALASNNQGRGPGGAGASNNGETNNRLQKTLRFKGQLSIGIDEVSNSLVLSAPAYLFDQVAKMINDLDKAAVPDYTVQMVHVGHGMSATRMKELLDEVYMQKSAENLPGEGRRVTGSSMRSKAAKPAAGRRAEAGPGRTD